MKPHVLIIEDDPSIADLKKDYLEINDMTVTIEHDGKKGLEAALNEPFDLIILDVMLPTMDGFEICRAIRKKKQTPIMIVSAKKEDIDKIRGLGLGADDYIIKPFSPNELVARAKAHMNRYQLLSKAEQPPQLLKINEIAVDTAAHKVFVLENEVIFTSKEYKLLVFLMEHPNRVWNKEELFESVWGFDALDTEVSTVVVHIKRIREKLKKANLSDSPIETLWGSGYRFNR
ncbi:DNA-binding response regulator [Enterococcus faecalis]|uniref:response regulator transcription factor n=1 Tax=Enterococcus faecalis TaxID=1351 RepID=UPI000CF31A0E|nr:response regulator transcription factor [Enterococcus faecalis]PQH02550.1 DNA-binding response regulator [Enterococcus faecalis]RBR86729.1 DNA-binding response regulator [Enterococcus faecalis]